MPPKNRRISKIAAPIVAWREVRLLRAERSYAAGGQKSTVLVTKLSMQLLKVSMPRSSNMAIVVPSTAHVACIPPPAALRKSAARSNAIHESTVVPGYSTETVRTSKGLRLTLIWQQGWESLVTWAVPVISFAIFASAGLVLITVGAAWWQGSMDVTTVSGPLVTRQGLDLLERQTGLPFRLLLLQAVLTPLLACLAQLPSSCQYPCGAEALKPRTTRPRWRAAAGLHRRSACRVPRPDQVRRAR